MSCSRTLRYGQRARGSNQQSLLTLTALAHCTRLSTDLIDFAWGAPEMHCGSVCIRRLRLLRPKVENSLTFLGSLSVQPMRSRYPSVRHTYRRPSMDVYSVQAVLLADSSTSVPLPPLMSISANEHLVHAQ